MAVVDAICWHGADPSALTRWSRLPSWGQMLVRALIFRIATRPAAPRGPAPDAADHPVVASVLAVANR